MLSEAQDNGATVFFSSHIISEVQAVADRVAIIREGKIVEVAEGELPLAESDSPVSLMNSAEIPGREITEILGRGPGVYGIRYLAWTRSIRHTQIDPRRRTDRIHRADGKGSGNGC